MGAILDLGVIASMNRVTGQQQVSVGQDDTFLVSQQLKFVDLDHSVAITTYFVMKGMDHNTSGVYDCWEVKGSPDLTGSQYTGGLATPLRDIHISMSWTVTS